MRHGIVIFWCNNIDVMKKIKDEQLRIVLGGNTLTSEEVAIGVVGIICQMCNTQDVTINTSFQSLGVDGMTMDEIVKMVEDVFHINLNDYKKMGIDSVKDLVDLVNQRVKAKGQ